MKGRLYSVSAATSDANEEVRFRPNVSLDLLWIKLAKHLIGPIIRMGDARVRIERKSPMDEVQIDGEI
jgi:F420-0:gamma-glutamyl ligase-like protein